MAEVEAALSPEERSIIANKHLIDATLALAEYRRFRMRALESAFKLATGRPWSVVRYFTDEEEADDVSVEVLRAMGLNPAGIGDFFRQGSPDDLRSSCDAVLSSGDVPPYGDLADSHHATCWRIYHSRAFAESRASYGAPARAMARQAARQRSAAADEAVAEEPRLLFPPPLIIH